MVDYRRRIFDDTLDQLQPYLRALSIHGPKGVGKTESKTSTSNTFDGYATGSETT